MAFDLSIIRSGADYLVVRFNYGKYKGQHCALVDVFLFNKNGEMLMQKRGRNKRNGAGKLHTSVGGHINPGEEPSFTVVHESIEELGVPAMVFSKAHFDQAYGKLKSYTDKMSILCEVGDYFLDYPSYETGKGNIQDRIWFYFGRSDGPIENPDGSCAGYEWMDMESYAQEVLKNPEQFTFPFRTYMEKFSQDISEFVKRHCS